MNADQDLYRPGTFGCHEALHMAMVLADTVDDQLVEHPAIRLNPLWLSMAERAREVLLDLYQAVGGAHLTAVDEDEKSPATIVLTTVGPPVEDPS